MLSDTFAHRGSVNYCVFNNKQKYSPMQKAELVEAAFIISRRAFGIAEERTRP